MSVHYTHVDSPVGPLLVAASDAGLHAIAFPENRHPVRIGDDWTRGGHPLIDEARRQLADYDSAERLARLLAGPLERAQAAGLVSAGWTVPDLVLAQRMVYGVILTELDPEAARAAAMRALRLVDPALAREE